MENIKSAYNSNKFKISAPTWNDEFDLPDDHILLHKYRITLSISLRNMKLWIYVNSIKNRLVFKIKTCYKLKLLSPETMKLLGSAKQGADKDIDGKHVPKLESVEVVLLHCNLLNTYQQVSRVLLTFVHHKQFEQLINISAHSLTMLIATNTEFSFIKIWFAD